MLAIEVELSTIPPYLYAMYSIEDQESDAALLIRSVVVEEMLHATLVANLLLSVGGDPKFSSAEIMPTYPGLMRHHIPPLMLHLEPCSEDYLRNTMMVIERPEEPGAPPEDDEYETLGQFYMAMELALRRLEAEQELFSDPKLDRQMSDPSFYGPVKFDAEDSGGLMGIYDLETAIAAIEIVVHQGEGLSDERWADPAHQELTHFYKFEQIADGVSPLGKVKSAPRDPSTADFDEAIQPVSDLFNGMYRMAYLTLDELYSPGADQGALVGRLYRLMGELMGPVGLYLMDQPGVGPTFEIYELGGEPLSELAQMASDVADRHPDLAGVAAGVASLAG